MKKVRNGLQFINCQIFIESLGSDPLKIAYPSKKQTHNVFKNAVQLISFMISLLKVKNPKTMFTSISLLKKIFLFYLE